MTEAIAIALLKLLLNEAPGVVLWVLRKAGLVPDNATHSGTIEPMRRVADIMSRNPMDAVRREVKAIPVEPPPITVGSYRGDPAAGDHFPAEYEKPESD